MGLVREELEETLKKYMDDKMEIVGNSMAFCNICALKIPVVCEDKEKKAPRIGPIKNVGVVTREAILCEPLSGSFLDMTGKILDIAYCVEKNFGYEKVEILFPLIQIIKPLPEDF